MRRMQQTALALPCRLAIETANPIFTHRAPGMIARLTINTGWE